MMPAFSRPRRPRCVCSAWPHTGPPLGLKEGEGRALRVLDHRKAPSAWDLHGWDNYRSPQTSRLFGVGIEVTGAEIDQPLVGDLGRHLGAPRHYAGHGAARDLRLGVLVRAAPAPAEDLRVKRF